MQVASRLLLVWPVVNVFPGLATSPAYSSMLIAWSVTEVIRYSYFALTLSGFQPGFITWLRYNTFYILYPLGISSECVMIYKAVEPARALRPEFAWALQLILLVYVPGECLLAAVVLGVSNQLMESRLLYLVHTHDGPEAEGYEGEGQGGAELGIIADVPPIQNQLGVPCAHAAEKSNRFLIPANVDKAYSSFCAPGIPLRAFCTTSYRSATIY